MDNEQKQQHREEFQKRLEAEGLDVEEYASEEDAIRAKYLKKDDKEDPNIPIIAENEAFAAQVMATLKARGLADHDELTGLLNKRGYENRLAVLQEHARKGGLPHSTSRRTDSPDTVSIEPFSMITFDIDHFKLVNDTYGHPAGDEVLKEVARRVQGRLRTGDEFARVGGEEFRVLALSANGAAPLVAEYLRRIIESEPFTVTYLDPVTQERVTKDIHITISLGVSPYFENNSQMEAVSDQALYAAKNGTTGSNRNQVWFWSKETGGLRHFIQPQA